uniref:Calmodulin n=2 Tax=Steinernema glaseri TaxID=37863 RepID=A0A1I7ZS12_9BILA
MTYTEADLPLQAPSLLQLTAQKVSEHSDLLGCEVPEEKMRELKINSDEPCSSSSLMNRKRSFEQVESGPGSDDERGPATAYAQRDRIRFPAPVSTALFRAFRKRHQVKPGGEIRIPAEVLMHFADPIRFPLEELDMSSLRVCDRDLALLIDAHKERLTKLDLTDVKGVNGRDLNHLLDERGVQLKNVRHLSLSNFEVLQKTTPNPRKVGVPKQDLPMLGARDLVGSSSSIDIGGVQNDNADDDSSRGPYIEMDVEPANLMILTGRCPNVRTLRLCKEQDASVSTDAECANEFLSRVLKPLKKVNHIDLSHWNHVEDLRGVLPSALNLTTLILFDVPDLYNAIETIAQLGQLRTLDLSQSSRDSGTYPKPVTSLHKLVTSLPFLSNLDISFTNLASKPSPDDRPFKGKGLIASDIFGLRYLRHKLNYLGIFNCENASKCGQIPAEIVCGDGDEDQIILALKIYKDRARILQSVLNESYQLYRFVNDLKRHTEALHLVLRAMKTHLSDSTLQIAGSASLFYIIRQVDMNRHTKMDVIAALLSGMEEHLEEQVMVRNCCLSLCQFEIPQDILFDYNHVARLLVQVLEKHHGDQLTQRIVVFLLNSMACHVDGDQKIEVGFIGAIETILAQIRRKLAAAICDEVMEVGWSFLWNITDETPSNCQRFLDNSGLELFHQCYSQFPNETELVRNMMGLIGNIAEVEPLRKQLMKDAYVQIFCNLLTVLIDGIEISYNSAGVLSHMVADGDALWTENVTLRRDDVQDRIRAAINTWQLEARRFINYRSFKPILKLLDNFDASASQMWAVWALANLTITDANKYCPYVCEEGGLVLLQMLEKDTRTSEEVLRLTKTVLENVAKWQASSSASQSTNAEQSGTSGEREETMDTS